MKTTEEESRDRMAALVFVVVFSIGLLAGCIIGAGFTMTLLGGGV